MGCAGCRKNSKASGRIYFECAVCGTLLHGPKKDMPKIGDTLICGMCDKKYKKLKELEKAAKTKKVKTDG